MNATSGSKLITIAVIMTLSLSCICTAGTWPAFRGHNGQGISDSKNIPAKWTDADYKWKITLPGEGPSSPVLWNNTLFVTATDPKAPKGILLAIDAKTGKELWKKEYPLKAAKMNSLNSYATCTPALTADAIYVLWSTANEAKLIALDHKGNEIFQKQYGPTASSHGPGVSPMVAGDMVVFTREQADGRMGVWIALDRRTGEQKWTIERDHGQISYSTPCIYQPAGEKPQLVFTSTTHGITGVEPATGRIIWEVKDAFIARVVSSPVIAGNLIVGSCGQGGGGKQITAVRVPAGGSGDAAIAWKSNDRATTQYVPTCLYKDGLLYNLHDGGNITCRKADSGDILWSEKPAGRFYASPVYADGKIYCVTREGQCVVLKAGDKYELLAINDLGEPSDATPAIVDDHLYLRTKSNLMCLPAKAK